MKQKPRSPKQRKHPKTRLRLPDLEFSKTAVLSSLTQCRRPTRIWPRHRRVRRLVLLGAATGLKQNGGSPLSQLP